MIIDCRYCGANVIDDRCEICLKTHDWRKGRDNGSS